MQLTTNVHYDRADKLISLFGYNAWVHYDCGDSTDLNFALSAEECFSFLRQNWVWALCFASESNIRAHLISKSFFGVLVTIYWP